MASALKDVFTAEKAAMVLGITKELVSRYCRDGRLPAEKFGVGWAIRRIDLYKFKKQPRNVGNPNFQK